MAACSPVRFAGKITGAVIGGKVAAALPTPKAKTIVDPKSGPFCDTMGALGWPLRASAEDKALIKQLSRGTKEPIVGAQTFGRTECPAWK